MQNFIVPATGTYYLGVSGSNNTAYDPNVASSGATGTTSTYTLTIKREDAAVTSITGITAAATSGTPAQSNLPSANTGQTITLTGSGFVSGDQVVFELMDGAGRLSLTTITPTTIAANGLSLDVVVPSTAATGMVRLARELVGRYLQIVPTLANVDDFSGVYHGGGLSLTGTGIYEGQGLAVQFGGQTLTDRSPFTGMDGFNTGVNLTVPEGVATGPIRIQTLGGTSTEFVRTFTSITATSTTGTPANGLQASANPGQAIMLNGTNLTLVTDVVFLVADASGNVSERIVNPTAVGAGGTSVTVIVPTDAITGVVQVVGDQLNNAIPLQIVPVISNADLTFVNVNQANFLLSGLGFIEANGTQYQFNTVTVLDAGPTTGPNVFSSNTLADMTLAYSDNLFGAVTVTTAGGTSAPFSVGFSQLTSVALSGTPADAGQASANPGQVVTLTGSGLSLGTDLVYKVINDNTGVTDVVALLNPFYVNTAGTEAQVLLPVAINGAFNLRMVGTSNAPLLQIVPVVTAVDVNGLNSAQVQGSGFVEGNNSLYQWAGGSLTDTAQGVGPDSVSSATRVNLALPVHGLGSFTVTTVGGTSAAVPWNIVSPILPANMVDVAFNGAANELLVATSGTGLIYRLNPATGATLGSFAIPVVNSNSLGLDITPVGITLRNTANSTDVAIAAGSLIVFNGGVGPNRIVAMNPTTGAILATLSIATANTVGGAVTATGRVFVLDFGADRVREIDPITGAEIVAGGFAAGMDINFGDIAIHPTTGNIWIASSQTTTLREYTAAGVLVRSIDVTPQNIDFELSGLAFRANGADFDVLASSTRGVIYILPDPLVNMPTDVSGLAGSVVTVPVNIDNGKGLTSALLEIGYDTDVLDVTASAVRLGSLTGGADLVVNVDDSAGTISIVLFLTTPLGAGAGSLVTIDYQIDPTATAGTTPLDLQSVILNDGALILTKEPITGVDATDGQILIGPRTASGFAEVNTAAPSNNHFEAVWSMRIDRKHEGLGNFLVEWDRDDLSPSQRKKQLLDSDAHNGSGPLARLGGFDNRVNDRFNKRGAKDWLFINALDS